MTDFYLQLQQILWYYIANFDDLGDTWPGPVEYKEITYIQLFNVKQQLLWFSFDIFFKSDLHQERTLYKKYSSNVYECVLLSVDQYIDELAVIGTNQPQHTSKFDMMSVVQEEEESEMLDESMPERPG